MGFLLHVTGLDNPDGHWYLWWSGFGADLAYLGVFTIIWHHLNCHADGCWRIARHARAGYCRKHAKET